MPIAGCYSSVWKHGGSDVSTNDNAAFTHSIPLEETFCSGGDMWRNARRLGCEDLPLFVVKMDCRADINCVSQGVHVSLAKRCAEVGIAEPCSIGDPSLQALPWHRLAIREP